MKSKLIENYGLQYLDKKNKLIFNKFLYLKTITNGKYCQLFEKKLSKIIGCKYTVVCNSGTSALMMALLSLSKKKIIAIVPNINFVAIINILKFMDAKIILSDVNENGMVDEKNLIKVLNYCKKKRLKPNVFIPIHYAGFVNNLSQMYKICKENKICIIDDGCHSFYSKDLDGYYVGASKFSLMTTFSFHPVKNITTVEGGAICTNKKYIYNKLKFLRSFDLKKTSLDQPYEANGFSLNFRMGEFNALLGIEQLKSLKKFKNKRIELVRMYKKHFKNIEDNIKILNTNDKNNFWHLLTVKLSPCLIKKKLLFMQYLQKNKIGCQIHYKPINLHKKFKKIINFENLKNSKIFYEQQLTLPLHYQMIEDNIIFIKKKIIIFLKKNKII